MRFPFRNSVFFKKERPIGMVTKFAFFCIFFLQIRRKITFTFLLTYLLIYLLTNSFYEEMLSNVDCKFLQAPFDYCSNFVCGKNYDFRKILIKKGEKNEPFWKEWPMDLKFYMYVLFIFYIWININCKKCIVSHTDFFSANTNICAQKLKKTHLPRFWPSYATEVGKVLGCVEGVYFL